MKVRNMSKGLTLLAALALTLAITGGESLARRVSRDRPWVRRSARASGASGAAGQGRHRPAGLDRREGEQGLLGPLARMAGAKGVKGDTG